MGTGCCFKDDVQCIGWLWKSATTAAWRMAGAAAGRAAFFKNGLVAPETSARHDPLHKHARSRRRSDLRHFCSGDSSDVWELFRGNARRFCRTARAQALAGGHKSRAASACLQQHYAPRRWCVERPWVERVLGQPFGQALAQGRQDCQWRPRPLEDCGCSWRRLGWTHACAAAPSA